MMRRVFFQNKIVNLLMAALILFIICSSPYYTSGEAYKNFRLKKIDDQQYAITMMGTKQSINAIADTHDLANLQASFDDIILFLLSIRMITSFIPMVLLSLDQLYRTIKRRNIKVSQTKNKIFMVHYLQLKDGKKNALSYGYSF